MKHRICKCRYDIWDYEMYKTISDIKKWNAQFTNTEGMHVMEDITHTTIKLWLRVRSQYWREEFFSLSLLQWHTHWNNIRIYFGLSYQDFIVSEPCNDWIDWSLLSNHRGKKCWSFPPFPGQKLLRIALKSVINFLPVCCKPPQHASTSDSTGSVIHYTTFSSWTPRVFQQLGQSAVSLLSRSAQRIGHCC